jgi:hypothetical protein
VLNTSPEWSFGRLHSAFEQESTKRVRVFKSVVLVPDYGWSQVLDSIRAQYVLRERRAVRREGVRHRKSTDPVDLYRKGE